MRVLAVGNSHLWTLMGWDRHAPRDSARLETVDGDLTLVGMAVTTSTAYGLVEGGSVPGGGAKLLAFIGSELPADGVLSVYGEVDCAVHVGRHGVPVPESIALTVARYARFLETIPGRVLVASTVPHSAGFSPGRTEEIRATSLAWNDAVLELCLGRGWDYVDLYSPFVGPDGHAIRVLSDREGENHLHPDDGPTMRAIVRQALSAPRPSPRAA